MGDDRTLANSLGGVGAALDDVHWIGVDAQVALRGGVGRWALSISAASSFVLQFVLAAGYALLVVISLQAPESGIAAIMADWDTLIGPAMHPVFEFFGGPACGGAAVGERARRVHEAYLQLVMVDLVIACGCFLASSPLWKDWARELRRLPRWVRADREQIERELEIGQGLAVLGAAAGGWFLFVGDEFFASAGCSSYSPWPFLHAPLLTAVIYGLSCFAAASNAARAP